MRRQPWSDSLAYGIVPVVACGNCLGSDGKVLVWKEHAAILRYRARWEAGEFDGIALRDQGLPRELWGQ